MAKKLNELMAFRCDPEDRNELRRVSKSLSISEPTIARVALREGLKVLSDHGIRPAPEPKHAA